MNLYEVIFDGVAGRYNGADVVYLVRAQDYKAAIETVCQFLDLKYHFHKEPPVLPDVVFEIGCDLSSWAAKVPLLLRGPYILHAHNYGWKRWERKASEDGTSPGEWEEKHNGDTTGLIDLGPANPA